MAMIMKRTRISKSAWSGAPLSETWRNALNAKRNLLSYVTVILNFTYIFDTDQIHDDGR